MNRTRIRAAAAAAVLLGLLMLPSGPALGASCPLSVSPASGDPGTRFTFTGHGYTPTQLRLTRDDHPAKIVQLQLNGADPFTFSIDRRVTPSIEKVLSKTSSWPADRTPAEATVRTAARRAEKSRLVCISSPS